MSNNAALWDSADAKVNKVYIETIKKRAFNHQENRNQMAPANLVNAFLLLFLKEPIFLFFLLGTVACFFIWQIRSVPLIAALFTAAALHFGVRVRETREVRQIEKEVNERTVIRVDATLGGAVAVSWQDLAAGDVILIQADDEAPCDCLLLSTSHKGGIGFFDSEVIAGSVVPIRFKQSCRDTRTLKTVQQACRLNGYVIWDIRPHPLTPQRLPNGAKAKFKGQLKLKDFPRPCEVSIDNVILKGQILRHTDWAFLLCVFTGKDCFIHRNETFNYMDQKGPTALLMERVSLFGTFITIICLLLQLARWDKPGASSVTSKSRMWRYLSNLSGSAESTRDLISSAFERFLFFLPLAAMVPWGLLRYLEQRRLTLKRGSEVAVLNAPGIAALRDATHVVAEMNALLLRESECAAFTVGTETFGLLRRKRGSVLKTETREQSGSPPTKPESPPMKPLSPPTKLGSPPRMVEGVRFSLEVDDLVKPDGTSPEPRWDVLEQNLLRYGRGQDPAELNDLVLDSSSVRPPWFKGPSFTKRRKRKYSTGVVCGPPRRLNTNASPAVMNRISTSLITAKIDPLYQECQTNSAKGRYLHHYLKCIAYATTARPVFMFGDLDTEPLLDDSLSSAPGNMSNVGSAVSGSASISTGSASLSRIKIVRADGSNEVRDVNWHSVSHVFRQRLDYEESRLEDCSMASLASYLGLTVVSVSDSCIDAEVTMDNEEALPVTVQRSEAPTRQTLPFRGEPFMTRFQIIARSSNILNNQDVVVTIGYNHDMDECTCAQCHPDTDSGETGGACTNAMVLYVTGSYNALINKLLINNKSKRLLYRRVLNSAEYNGLKTIIAAYKKLTPAEMNSINNVINEDTSLQIDIYDKLNRVIVKIMNKKLRYLGYVNTKLNNCECSSTFMSSLHESKTPVIGLCTGKPIDVVRIAVTAHLVDVNLSHQPPSNAGPLLPTPPPDPSAVVVYYLQQRWRIIHYNEGKRLKGTQIKKEMVMLLEDFINIRRYAGEKERPLMLVLQSTVLNAFVQSLDMQPTLLYMLTASDAVVMANTDPYQTKHVLNLIKTCLDGNVCLIGVGITGQGTMHMSACDCVVGLTRDLRWCPCQLQASHIPFNTNLQPAVPDEVGRPDGSQLTPPLPSPADLITFKRVSRLRSLRLSAAQAYPPLNLSKAILVTRSNIVMPSMAHLSAFINSCGVGSCIRYKALILWAAYVQYIFVMPFALYDFESMGSLYGFPLSIVAVGSVLVCLLPLGFSRGVRYEYNRELPVYNDERTTILDDTKSSMGGQFYSRNRRATAGTESSYHIDNRRLKKRTATNVGADESTDELKRFHQFVYPCQPFLIQRQHLLFGWTDIVLNFADAVCTCLISFYYSKFTEESSSWPSNGKVLSNFQAMTVIALFWTGFLRYIISEFTVHHEGTIVKVRPKYNYWTMLASVIVTIGAAHLLFWRLGYIRTLQTPVGRLAILVMTLANICLSLVIYQLRVLLNRGYIHRKVADLWESLNEWIESKALKITGLSDLASEYQSAGYANQPLKYKTVSTHELSAPAGAGAMSGQMDVSSPPEPNDDKPMSAWQRIRVPDYSVNEMSLSSAHLHDVPVTADAPFIYDDVSLGVLTVGDNAISSCVFDSQSENDEPGCTRSDGREDEDGAISMLSGNNVNSYRDLRSATTALLRKSAIQTQDMAATNASCLESIRSLMNRSGLKFKDAKIEALFTYARHKERHLTKAPYIAYSATMIGLCIGAYVAQHIIRPTTDDDSEWVWLQRLVLGIQLFTWLLLVVLTMTQHLYKAFRFYMYLLSVLVTATSFLDRWNTLPLYPLVLCHAAWLFVISQMRLQDAVIIAVSQVTVLCFSYYAVPTHTTSSNNRSLAFAVFLMVNDFGSFAYMYVVGARLGLTDRTRFWLNYKVELAKVKKRDILTNMLPTFVVDMMLKNGVNELGVPNGMTAICPGTVTVIFCDVYDFHMLVKQLEPTHLVELLDSLFVYFDRLVDSFEVIKIETVFETYLSCAGITPSGEGTPEELTLRDCFAAIDFALTQLQVVAGITYNVRETSGGSSLKTRNGSLQNEHGTGWPRTMSDADAPRSLMTHQHSFLKGRNDYDSDATPPVVRGESAGVYQTATLNATGETTAGTREETVRREKLHVKIGMHTGSVTAGVVGGKKPQYALFGDTVNTASRMKLTGQKDKIHVSHVTYELLKNDPSLVWEKQTMTIKGKGVMDTYLLTRVEGTSYPTFADSEDDDWISMGGDELSLGSSSSSDAVPAPLGDDDARPLPGYNNIIGRQISRQKTMRPAAQLSDDRLNQLAEAVQNPTTFADSADTETVSPGLRSAMKHKHSRRRERADTALHFELEELQDRGSSKEISSKEDMANTPVKEENEEEEKPRLHYYSNSLRMSRNDEKFAAPGQKSLSRFLNRIDDVSGHVQTRRAGAVENEEDAARRRTLNDAGIKRVAIRDDMHPSASIAQFTEPGRHAAPSELLSNSPGSSSHKPSAVAFSTGAVSREVSGFHSSRVITSRNSKNTNYAVADVYMNPRSTFVKRRATWAEQQNRQVTVIGEVGGSGSIQTMMNGTPIRENTMQAESSESSAPHQDHTDSSSLETGLDEMAIEKAIHSQEEGSRQALKELNFFTVNWHNRQLEKEYRDFIQNDEPHIKYTLGSLIVFLLTRGLTAVARTYTRYTADVVQIITRQPLNPVTNLVLAYWVARGAELLCGFFVWTVLHIMRQKHSSKQWANFAAQVCSCLYICCVLSFVMLPGWTFEPANSQLINPSWDWATDLVEFSTLLLILHHNNGFVFQHLVTFDAFILTIIMIYLCLVVEPSSSTRVSIVVLPFIVLLMLLSAYIKETQERVSWYITRSFRHSEDKAKEMLVDMLPKQVLEEFQADRLRLAYSHNDITFLFADIVGFTNYSSTVSPEEVVNLLQRLFAAFDHDSTRFNLFKLCTIGDAYVAVSDPPTDSQTGYDPIPGLLNVWDMTQAMLVNIKHIREQVKVPQLDMRIGCHLGSCVGGVIGSGRIRYDFWGMDVLIGNSMESNGFPGKINVSNAWMVCVESQFPKAFSFEFNRTVDVQGVAVDCYLATEEQRIPRPDPHTPVRTTNAASTELDTTQSAKYANNLLSTKP